MRDPATNRTIKFGQVFLVTITTAPAVVVAPAVQSRRYPALPTDYDELDIVLSYDTRLAPFSMWSTNFQGIFVKANLAMVRTPDATSIFECRAMSLTAGVQELCHIWPRLNGLPIIAEA